MKNETLEKILHFKENLILGELKISFHFCVSSSFVENFHICLQNELNFMHIISFLNKMRMKNLAVFFNTCFVFFWMDKMLRTIYQVFFLAFHFFIVQCTMYILNNIFTSFIFIFLVIAPSKVFVFILSVDDKRR